MKSRLTLFLSLLLLGVALGAQTVDRDEFSDILNTTINFVNYTGAHDRIDTLEQITSIGKGLSVGLVRDRNGTTSFGDKYSVIHALGTPEEKGKPADIIILLPNSGVDHIDNVRRIISAYLMAMYGYAKPDADVLAVFLTIYNAVYRGNLTLFEGRYKASVLKHLSADKVGLALKYTEWPGKTQIVIPLSMAASDKSGSSLAAVSTASLVTPEVIETVRDKPGTGTKERQQLSNLMDRGVDQEQNAIDQKKAQIAADLAANQKRQQEIDAQLAANKATQDKAAASKSSTSTTASDKAATDKTSTATTSTATSDKAAADKTAADNKSLTAEKQKLADEQKALQADSKQLDNRQAENKETAAASKDLRTSTAADLKDQGKETASASVPTIVLKARLEKGMILSQPQRVVIGSPEVLQQSTVTALLGRRVFGFGDGLLGLILEGDLARSVLLSKTDLEITKKGATMLSPYSEVILLAGDTEFLAVMQYQNEWYLGAFDLQLNLIKDKRSDIAIDPVGAIVVTGDKVTVQKKDGRFTILDLKDLKVGK